MNVMYIIFNNYENINTININKDCKNNETCLEICNISGIKSPLY